MRTIDYDDVIAGLEAIIADKPEGYNYNQRIAEIVGDDDDQEYLEYSGIGCQYTVKEQPACLIGVYLDSLGIGVAPTLQGDRIPSVIENNGLVPYPGQDEVRFTDRAVQVMGTAQIEQDGQVTWHRALQFARQYALREFAK